MGNRPLFARQAQALSGCSWLPSGAPSHAGGRGGAGREGPQGSPPPGRGHERFFRLHPKQPRAFPVEPQST